MKPRVLYYDIETGPSLAYVFSLWDQNIGLNQIVEQGEILCASYSWDNSKKVHTVSVWEQGLKAMVQDLHAALSEADWVVTYNGRSFDNKIVHAAMIELGLTPPSPYENIDLFRAVKANFKWPSYKLAYVLQRLGLEEKIQTGGFDLWKRCMAGDWDAINEMLDYNRQDVRVLKGLYKKLLPWIHNHPNQQNYVMEDVCPFCGSSRIQRRGYARTKTQTYPRLQCQDCGGWLRGVKREWATDLRSLKTSS